MSIEDYRDYKSNTGNMNYNREKSSVRNGSKTRRSASATGVMGGSRTGGYVKNGRKVKKHILTPYGRKFFARLGVTAMVGAIGITTAVGLATRGKVVAEDKYAHTTTPPAMVENGSVDRDNRLDEDFVFGNMDNEISEEQGIYISSYGSKQYKYCTEEYALQLAEDAIENVNEMFGNAGMKPLVEGDDEYLPDYFDKYMLVGLACTESSLRCEGADGEPLYSSVKARGMCQCKEDTLDYVKWYAKTVLGVKLDYEFEDLDDPRVSLEVAALVLATNAENYYKPTKKDNAFSQSGLSFSQDAQKKLMLSSYYYGGKGALNRLVKNGTTSSDYANKILNYESSLREKYGEMSR